jgi:hypothetical protein
MKICALVEWIVTSMRSADAVTAWLIAAVTAIFVTASYN